MRKMETNETVVDWEKVQRWLQSAAMELDYLVFRVIAKRNGRMPERSPSIFAIANDMDEPLTEELLRSRIKDIARLSEGWQTSETFPSF